MLLSEPYVWFKGCNDNGTYAYCALAVVGKLATIHLKVTSFSASILKALKADFHVIVTMCRGHGATEILIINPEPDEKWFKFIRNFGFDKPMGVARMMI